METMKINQINLQNFKGAVVSLSAVSDTHGQLSRMSDFCSAVEENKDDIFLKEQKGNKNVFVLPGDWFMAGDVKGYKSNPEYNSQKFQLIFFNKLVTFLNTLSNRTSVIFCPGNHEFDAGEQEFVESMDKIHSKVVLTNANFETSPLIKSLTDKKKITKSEIIKVQDDKDPNLYHEVLFVSAAPGNMSYYNKKIKGIDFSDNVYKPQAELKSEDVQNSIKAINEEIQKFKTNNPKGAVVLLDHFAGIFQKELLEQNLGIDVILSAHEHEDEKLIDSNGTIIIKLSQNFAKLENVKIKFDDEGNVEAFKLYTCKTKKSSNPNPVKSFYNKIFKNDLEKKYTIPAQEDVDFSLEGIRYQNNHLANYICDVIAHEIKEKYPTDLFAINASAIRGELLTQNEGQIDNTHLIMILNGIKKEDANIMITKVTGEELLEIICDNLLFNNIDHQKNPLMQYSGIKIDKENILYCLKNNSTPASLCGFVKTQDNSPIEKDKTYYFANVEKFFLKSKSKLIKNLYHDSERTFKTTLNAREVLQNYFEKNSKAVTAKNEQRYY